MAKSVNLGVILHKFKSDLTNCVSSDMLLNSCMFNFLIYKLEITLLPTHGIMIMIKLLNICKELRKALNKYAKISGYYYFVF